VSHIIYLFLNLSTVKITHKNRIYLKENNFKKLLERLNQFVFNLKILKGSREMVIDVTIESCLVIKVGDIKKISAAAWATTKQLFTYKNPKYLENEKWGYSNFDTPRYLHTFEVHGGLMYVSRGGYERLENHLKKFKATINPIDRTFVGPSIRFEHNNIILREDQNRWVNDLLKFKYGCGQAYTSFGKTVASSAIIQKIGQVTTILVHTTFLQSQWIEELTNPKLFNIDPNDIGGVGGIFSSKKKFVAKLGAKSDYKKRKMGKVNVCLYQSLCKPDHLKFFEKETGLLIFDEGQKSPIEGVQKVINKFRCRYKYAVSAGFIRKDGKEFMTFDTFGPIRVVAVEKASDSKILSQIFLVKSNYEDEQYKEDGNYTSMITRMGRDRDRNILICKRGLAKVKKGKLVLILVERKEQAARLFRMLSNFKVDMLLGSVNPKKVKEDQRTKEEIRAKKKPKFLPKTIQDILLNYDETTAYDRIKTLANKKKLQFIIGTQKAEVGLSIRPLDHVIVTTLAGNNMERFNQIKGRPERTYSEKQEEFFGGKKERPTIDVIVDNMRISQNAAEAIKDKYGDDVIRLNKRRTKIRKKGEQK
jgi:superfamily II DNA or RNA helicase